jgi:hypothetical protein
MNKFFQTNEYTVAVSEITGRTILINDSMHLFLLSPQADVNKIHTAAQEWLARIKSTPVTARPAAPFTKKLSELVECKTLDQSVRVLEEAMVSEFLEKSQVNENSRRFVSDLLLRLWSYGAIAWPPKLQGALARISLRLDTPGLSEKLRKILETVYAYVTRGVDDDAANCRFIFDYMLTRVGVVEIGDFTPTTFYFKEDRLRIGKLRSVGILAVLRLLQEYHYEQAISWSAEDFGFFKSRMGHLARDEKFQWLLAADPNMKAWANLAIEHLENTPSNFKSRRNTLNVFLKHFLSHPSLPRNPVEYFVTRNPPAPIFENPGNKGRQQMTLVKDFTDDVLIKVCTETDDNEMPVILHGFSNPHILPVYKGINTRETHREAMPTRLINLAAHILTKNDFAWPKSLERKVDVFRWRNPETGEYESIWSPVRTYAVLIKLMLFVHEPTDCRCRQTGEGAWRRREG